MISGEIIEELYKLLLFYFKSIYCLISKPVISITPDKVKIQLFYYLTIPKKRIVKLFAIHYLNSFKNKWIKLNKNTQPSYGKARLEFNNNPSWEKKDNNFNTNQMNFFTIIQKLLLSQMTRSFL